MDEDFINEKRMFHAAPYRGASRTPDAFGNFPQRSGTEDVRHAPAGENLKSGQMRAFSISFAARELPVRVTGEAKVTGSRNVSLHIDTAKTCTHPAKRGSFIRDIKFMESTELQLFVVTTPDSIVGIRMDRILSFRYENPKGPLTIRYIGDPNPEKLEGPLAEAMIRELRYAGRK